MLWCLSASRRISPSLCLALVCLPRSETDTIIEVSPGYTVLWNPGRYVVWGDLVFSAPWSTLRVHDWLVVVDAYGRYKWRSIWKPKDLMSCVRLGST